MALEPIELIFKQPIIIPEDTPLPEFEGFTVPEYTDGEDLSETREYLLELAQQFLDSDYVPIPLVGKRPIVAEWQKITTKTAKGILERTTGFDNLGLLTGKTGGITVIDIDNSAEDKGSDYFKQILREARLRYPDTYTVATGGGGTHLYFNYVGDGLLSAPLRDGKTRFHIDIKNNGGQVVAPGSIHPVTGKEYLVTNSSAPIDMPDRLFQVLRKYQDLE